MRVLVLTGAGVSAESGIPTFRGKDGYWRNLDPAKLATPEAFARDPKLVWEWYRERRNRIWNAQPNAAHAAIATLAQHADEFLLVTQNVDDLHARAGLPKEKMVQIHGDIFLTRCSRCDFGFTERKHDHEQEEEEENVVPRCAKCGALMRPGVVWFGEQLPWTELRRVETYLDRRACDVGIVVGTTATFGYIVDWALRASPNAFGVNLSKSIRRKRPSRDSQPDWCASRLRLLCRALSIRSLIHRTSGERKRCEDASHFKALRAKSSFRRLCYFAELLECVRVLAPLWVFGGPIQALIARR